ncbi:hypothetical protein SH661x_004146 [Planctomicrobium sp. SH661]|uniref:hypothetical protein n=1 Tax=Planctomicrobium sp. SH661 TaxID=3448124 RepID=UPI003F5B3D08
MHHIRAVLATGLILQLSSALTCAAPPRDSRSATPIVSLSPQIEELDDSTIPAPLPSAVAEQQEGKSPAVAAPRQLFPSPRQFFKSLTRNSVAPDPAPAAAPQNEAPLGTRRDIVTISGQQLSPIPESPRIEPPLPQLITPDYSVDPPQQVSELPPVSCDQCTSEPGTVAVAPRSPKIGSRLRFPHLSSLFAK